MTDDEILKIKIKGNEITLTDCAPTYFDLDGEATRSWKTGILKRNRIRSNCLKLECTIENQPESYIRSVLALIDDSQFQVEVFDKYKNARENKTMYCGDRGIAEYKSVDGLRASLSFSLIEL